MEEHNHTFDKNALLCNQYTIGHLPDRFVFDFRSAFPQFEATGEASIVIAHKSVLLDPLFAKQFLASLAENVRAYEQKFGEIKVISSVPKGGEIETTSEKASYIG